MNPFDDVTGPGFTSLVVSYSPTLPMLPPALEQQLAISASWFTNPTVGMFQEQLAGPLGGAGKSCIATGFGMAAILADLNRGR